MTQRNIYRLSVVTQLLNLFFTLYNICDLNNCIISQSECSTHIILDCFLEELWHLIIAYLE